MAFGSPQWMYSSGSDYELEQSLKFNEARSPYLSRTPSSAGNRKTFTYSCWMKIGNIGNDNNIIHARESANDRFHFLMTSNYLGVSYYVGGTEKWIRTTELLRDPSAWYHIVLRVDTTQSTGTNRVRIYVNGEVQSLYTGQMPTQNWDLAVNNNVEHRIGQRISNNDYKIDGYLTEIHLVDGTSLAPTSFGETGTYGEWKPIDCKDDLTYGTNGFYLPFKQDYTVEGFSTVTYRGTGASQYIGGVGFKPELVWTKVRTAGSAHGLFDIIRGPSKALYSNLTTAEETSSSFLKSFENDGFDPGSNGSTGASGESYVAWNWDMDSSTRTKLNISAEGTAKHVTAQSKVPASSSSIYTPSGSANYVQLGSDGDIDFGSDNFTIEFWIKDGSGYFLSGYGGTHNIYMQQTGSSAGTIYINTSGGSGTISISPTWSNWVHIAIVRNSNTFTAYIDGTSAGTLTLSGTVSSSAYRLGRNGTDTADGSGYFDELRISNTARYTGNFTAPTTAFSEDANTLMLIHSLAPNNQTYILDGGSISTAGSINSSVMANPTYGQSIVSYTGNSTNGATVGHGLSSAPEMVIVKQRGSANNWAVYFHTLADTQAIRLQSNSAATTENWFNNTNPTSSVVELRGAATVNSGNMIMYCFHSVTGYSKFGSYTGTGSSGNSVTTGFRPAFLLVKNSNDAEHWRMYDNVRDSDNVANHGLIPSNGDAENSDSYFTFDSNGFTVTVGDNPVNGNGDTIIYMAFADTREYAYWLDQSGNNNDWTSNNLTESDISVDSPTNNFATWNPLDNSASFTLSEGNLKSAVTGVNDLSPATFGMSSGKWYFEYYLVSGSDDVFGVSQQGKTDWHSDTGTWVLRSGSGSGAFSWNRDTSTNYDFNNVNDFTNADVVSVAVDMDSGKIWFAINGTWNPDASNNTPNPASGTYPRYSNLSGTIVPVVSQSISDGASTWVANFGQDSSFAGNKTAQGNQDSNGIGDFYYTPPSGYLALCTKNLPDVDVVPSEHFNTVLWAGNGSAGHAITGVGFPPDLLWTAERTSTSANHLFDSVRDYKGLYTNLSNAESNQSAMTGPDSDGFTVGVSGGYNESGQTYVGWNWKANGSGSANNDGDNNATVSVNTDAKFSIVSYTGSGGEPKTVAHGLGVSPEMVIIKKRNNAGSWIVWHKDLADNYAFEGLNTNGAAVSGGSPISKYVDAVSSTLVTLGDASENNNSGDTFIMYCWASVDGYSKVGAYTGNDSTDGPFVYTGFRPAWVMTKSIGTGNSWWIIDNKRDTYNEADAGSRADDSSAEMGTYMNKDLLSNGFKIRTANGQSNGSNSGNPGYIYIAFAESPFKYSNAR